MAKVTLEQWHSLIAVVEKGGYAQAAEALNKSQSSVSYAIQKLETQLNVRVFSVEGRKAVLTPVGKTLYQRAQLLVADAEQVEKLASTYSTGWEPVIKVSADALFPDWMMLDAIDAFMEISPLTRVEALESVLSGTEEALLNKTSDIVITASVPPGFVAEKLFGVSFGLFTSPDHPLQQLNRAVTQQDLRLYRQIVVKDSGSRDIDSGWLEAQQRLTFSHFYASVQAVERGLGFSWLPDTRIQECLKTNSLVELPHESIRNKQIDLYLIQREGELAGPATKKLAQIITQLCTN